MTSNNKKLSSFIHSFSLPTKDFVKLEEKELTVQIEYKINETNNYMRGQRIGVYHFENCYFKVNIPKYILDYIKGKYKQYTKDGISQEGTYSNGRPIYKEKYDFKDFIKHEKFVDVIKSMQTIVNDALHIKKIENLEKENKVIFVKSIHNMKEDIDSYNKGHKGNIIDLHFQFFVAYKVIKNKNLIKEYWQNEQDNNNVIEYYSTIVKTTKHNSIRLPLLTGHNIKEFVEIQWTQKREDFFRNIENKIQQVSSIIDDFVKDINIDNIDLKIAEQKHLMIEDKK